jgi:MoaA/NifB/PqqE/SkfB family radical SAM enzyme
VPVLILSGGEPLMRPDIFEIAERAKAMKFYTGLSTNGTLIDEPWPTASPAMGFDYVGISLDGLRETHDNFRRLEGAFDRSLAAVRLLHAARREGGPAFHHDGHERARPAGAARPDAPRMWTSSISRT